MRKLKSLFAGVAVAAALAVPMAASAAPTPKDPPVPGEANCTGQYAAYANSVLNSDPAYDAYSNGQKGFAELNGLSVKDLKEAVRLACGA